MTDRVTDTISIGTVTSRGEDIPPSECNLSFGTTEAGLSPYSDISTSAESYPPIHSLLLCPSQWTALLESPVSLVRKVNSIDDMESSCNTDSNNISISGDSYSMCSGVVDRIIEEEEDDDDDDDNEEEEEEGEGEESHTLEPVSLTVIDEPPTQEDEIEEECEEQVERIPSTPAHLLPTTCNAIVTTTASTNGSSSSECALHEEGGIRGNNTPTSLPSTPLDNRFPIHFTHSRNVSETPSLPPFISSSSSSAYHSRNSSMASQITSDCFETDSQFTDIDSCIVTYSSDIHSRPISLQESRFKFPEVSAMEKSIQRQCYAIGDITTPICVPEHLFVPTTTIEEGSNGEVMVMGGENFEGKKIGIAGLKSSEWIKKEMRRSRQSMIQVKVSSKSRHVVHFNVKAGDMFLWEFATKRKDIAFGLSFEATEVATEQEHDPDEEEDQQAVPPEVQMVPILPVLRVNTHTHPVIGSHTATQDGVYELLFDNSYSRFFAKELYYRITTKPSIPNEHYLDQ